MVKINNLTVRIKNQVILDKINCTLLPYTITCFIGKSGAGKTTILKSLVKLISPIEGEIVTNDQKIGYVFQDFNLFANLTVLENCIDPLIVNGSNYNDAHQIAINELTKLDMQDYINKYPNELSGGQQQRVAIARSLCLKPNILLLDEPTASLDPINTDALVNILKILAKDGFTIAVSSQDMNFINKIFDRVYYIEKGKILDFCDEINNLNNYLLIKNFI
ncbi:MAG: ATP-binding cassette domain-containing protein [Candidatus Babeliales bacterium]|nr:ATP-binding cassette domain-containing protein [Candidatus Babeliales bacterium]